MRSNTAVSKKLGNSWGTLWTSLLVYYVVILLLALLAPSTSIQETVPRGSSTSTASVSRRTASFVLNPHRAAGAPDDPDQGRKYPAISVARQPAALMAEHSYAIFDSVINLVIFVPVGLLGCIVLL
jgi:hypothetical protein